MFQKAVILEAKYFAGAVVNTTSKEATQSFGVNNVTIQGIGSFTVYLLYYKTAVSKQ
jgi:hypothetical protein